MKEYSEKIYESIKAFLDGDDWKYSFSADSAFFEMGVKLDCKLKSTKLMIRVGEDDYTVYATIALNADGESRAAVAEYLTRVNWRLRCGCFEMDMSDGEIHYKIFVDCGDDCDCLPTYSVVRNSVYIAADMVRKYSDGLLAVMYGFQTPEEAAKATEA